MRIWAHRGCSQRYPENTLLAFKKALEIKGLSGIELDIQLTRDGHMVVIHDEKVDRTTYGSGMVKDFTLKEIQSLKIKTSYGEDTLPEIVNNPKLLRIPTIEEVLELLKDRMLDESDDFRLNIELKNSIVRYEGMEEKIVALAKKMGLEKRIVYSTFYARSLQVLHSLGTESELGMLDKKASDCMYKAKSNEGVTAIHPFWRAMDLSKIEIENEMAPVAVRAWLTGHLYPELPTGTKLDLAQYEELGITDMFLNEPEAYLIEKTETKREALKEMKTEDTFSINDGPAFSFANHSKLLKHLDGDESVEISYTDIMDELEKKMEKEGEGANPFFTLEELFEYGFKTRNGKVSGIRIPLYSLTPEFLFLAIIQAEMAGGRYIVLETLNESSFEHLDGLVEELSEIIREKNINIYIELGAKKTKNGKYLCSAFSDTRNLISHIKSYNKISDSNLFGLAIDIGIANLIVKNFRSIAEEAGSLIKLIHANDNDGFTDQKQMIMTFSKGSGKPTTDWFGIIGSLVKNDFDGDIVFNMDGLWNTVPDGLLKSMLKLTKNIQKEWSEQFQIKKRISGNSKLILFGTGPMMVNFAQTFGTLKLPLFLVDRNPQTWGMNIAGIQIYEPEAILNVPKEERCVYICNVFYDECKAILDELNVEYFCYNDNYFM